MEIIIAFIVIGIISSVLRNLGNAGANRPAPRNTNPQDVFRKVIEQAGKENPFNVPNMPKPPEVKPQQDMERRSSTPRMGSLARQSLEGTTLEGTTLEGKSSGVSLPKEVPVKGDLTKQGITDGIRAGAIGADKPGKKLSFTQDNVLNGIIFSEILQPPKGRRR